MRVVSVNVGLPRAVEWDGKTVTTGIFKEPVVGRVAVRRLNLDGDRQADLSVHGGPDKAVYAYPAEHYSYWRAELPGMELSWARFGENLTTEGLLEDEVNIGDRFRAGTAELLVSQPRMPCYKLGIRFGRADMVRRFLSSERPGIYFRVSREGEVMAGDPITLLARAERSLTVADIVRLYVGDRADADLLRRAANLDGLAPFWRAYFAREAARQQDRRGA